MFSPDSHPGLQGAAPEERSSELAALGTAAPDLSPAEVQALVARLYGIEGFLEPPVPQRKGLVA